MADSAARPLQQPSIGCANCQCGKVPSNQASQTDLVLTNRMMLLLFGLPLCSLLVITYLVSVAQWPLAAAGTTILCAVGVALAAAHKLTGHIFEMYLSNNQNVTPE